jgi:hypothetical protein
MKKSRCVSPKSQKKMSSRRAAAAAVVSLGAGVLGTQSAEAGIVIIDLTKVRSDFGNLVDFTGPNAGLTDGSTKNFIVEPINGNVLRLNIQNYQGQSQIYNSVGFSQDANDPSANGLIAYGGFSQPGSSLHQATPTAFSFGTSIDNSAFSSSLNDTYGRGPNFRFRYGTGQEYLSPDITNKYLAFKTSITAPNTAANYGWIKVNWNATTRVFELLGAAYESEAGVAIMAGDTGAAAVPEPTTMAVFGLGALVLGAGKVRKQRAARRQKQAEALSV